MTLLKYKSYIYFILLYKDENISPGKTGCSSSFFLFALKILSIAWSYPVVVCWKIKKTKIKSLGALHYRPLCSRAFFSFSTAINLLKTSKTYLAKTTFCIMNYYPVFQEGAYFENPDKEDPTVYVSEKTGRGPLETDWIVDTWAGMLISRMSSCRV